MAIITLAPKGNFHIGEPVGIERQRVLGHIPSDTLFAALATAWAERGEIGAKLALFQNGSPPFLLTSAFPCLYERLDDQALRPVLRFFPRPVVKIHADQEVKDRVGKRLKQATWVSETLFWRLCKGEDVSNACQNELFGPGGFWVTAEEAKVLYKDAEGHLKPLWKQWDVPRVTLDRQTNAGTLYHIGRVTLRENVGLWFAVRGDMATIREALDMLADGGIGGLRSTGHGAFTWASTEGDLSDPGNSGYVVTLARYAPRDENEVSNALQTPHTAYKLDTIGGWCVDDHHHAWRRRSVHMIAEGGVLGAKAVGQLVDVTPDKPGDWQEEATPWSFSDARRVYRWGYAFPVGIAPAALPEEVSYA